MTYRELYKLLQQNVEAKAAIYNFLNKKVAEAKGFADINEFLSFIKVEGEWIAAENQFIKYEAQIEGNGADLDSEIDVKALYPYLDIKI